MLGYGVTRVVLDSALPALVGRQHLVIVKDVTDARYHPVGDAYRSAELLSPSSEVRTLGAVLKRQRIEYQTPEHCLREWRQHHASEAAAGESMWGQDMPRPGPMFAGDWISLEMPALPKPAPSVLGRFRQLIESPNKRVAHAAVERDRSIDSGLSR
jgi:hypothetical protein